MSASASLIPELEDIIQHGSHDKRAATVKRIARLHGGDIALAESPRGAKFVVSLPISDEELTAT